MSSAQTCAAFYATAIGLASLLAGTFWLLGFTYTGLPGTLLGSLTMFTPLAAVLVVQRLRGERPFSGLGARPTVNRWFLAAVGVALLMATLATVIGFALPGVSFDPSIDGLLATFAAALPPEELEEVRAQLEALPVHPALLSIPQVIFFGATLNAVFAFGEELGWRGLLYRELRPLGFWSSSWLVGALWGLWHAPLILLGHNYPGQPLLGVALFTVQCAAMSPLYTLARERSGSVWAAAVLHGTFNAAAGLPLLITQGGSPTMTGVTGLAGLFGLVVLDVLLWLVVRPGGTITLPRARAS